MAANAAQKSPEAFRTISEVATELEVPQHVLRFWETKFAPVKPLKRGGGRRYYRPDDLDLLRGIRALLYADGLTIKGVQKILREQGPRYVMEIGRGDASLMPPPARTPARETDGAERGAKQPAPSNVHPFPRESEAGPGGRTRLDDADTARFSALLDELLDLKSRLASARRASGL
jgi:DNA-binding transcriptional MerR regulator